ncbi:MAG: hypothetical protein GY861_14310 [bacterium]|nr:hypothetical protein [bacterium]
MSNIWEHPNIIAAEALTHLEDALVIAPLCAKDKTSDFTTKSNGWKVGDSVSFRTHGEYEVDEFTSTISTQSIASSTRAMTIEKHFDISVEVTAAEQKLDLDSFVEQVIRPATYKLAEKVDTYIGTKLIQASGAYYSTGLFETAADIALARKAATLQQLAMNRFCLVDLDIEATLLGQTWFNQSQTRGGDGEATLRNATMGRVMGMDWYASIAFPTETTAATVGTFVSTTNNTSSTTNLIGDKVLVTDGCGTSTLTLVAGDRIAVAGVRRPLICTDSVANAGSTGSTTLNLNLQDPITEVIPDGAAVTVIASGKDVQHHGVIMDDRSLAVAFPMLDLPEDRVAANANNNGVGIRIVKGYDLSTKKTTMSLDLLCGAFALDPRRITLVGDKTA